ncbi:hypothetical protein [Haloechinothrix salitolerans]|uniref:Transcriptional regulator, ArsR family n=1 Tax=Haloechinothrix salitolerans TaxID=926830 RepID=A0ABW2C0B5_9PSEU
MCHATRQGTSIFYSLRYPRLVEVIDVLRGVMAEEAGRRQGLVAKQ